MSDETTMVRTRPRRHWATALLLSILTMGVGHIYAGRGMKGAVLFALGFISAPAMVLLAFLEPSNGVFYAFVLIPFAVLLVYLYAIVDSAVAAKRASRPYVMKAYNHVALYCGLIVLGLILSMSGVVLVKAVAFEAFHLPTASNAPTFVPGDRILVNKQAFDPNAVRRGDIVVFKAPGEDKNFIKRIIGLPGETIRIEQGIVFVNGRKLGQEPLDGGEAREGSYRIRPAKIDLAEQTIPARHIFVLGDNRANSYDSRQFGTVPVGDVKGVAHYRFFPAERAGPIR